ncbi:MAG: GGDEF domain-containing protein [Pseudomonadota bacterium]|nr:GGDEF domain-containing protein [Pseudomonadota bacterium]
MDKFGDWHALDAAAWEQSYLDPLGARDVGHELVALGDEAAAAGWLQVAFAEARVGNHAGAQQALQQLRRAESTWPDPRRAALRAEIEVIVARPFGEFEQMAAMLAAIDAKGGLPTDAMFEFIAHDSRAINAKLLGQTDLALRHFYAALAAAQRTGWVGPRITATGNLGGYHQDLFNLEDARALCEQSMKEARQAGARHVLTTACCNLIVIYYALGEWQAARDTAQFMLTHGDQLLPGLRNDRALALALAHLGVGEIKTAAAYLVPGATSHDADGDGVTFRAWVQGRCLLAQGDAAGARKLAETILRERLKARLSDQPYDLMSLHRVMADACEQGGDPQAALDSLRSAHALYEQLVGRSARARFIALEISHNLSAVQHERDAALDFGRSADDDRRRLSELNAALQSQIAETELLHAKLREQALRDPLTGLHNRRYLFAVAPGLLELAQRQNAPLCVVLMDLDHFKLLNDTYGHDAGDIVLQRFSTLLSQMLRGSDVVVRHGGEEFVAVMPDLDGEGAAVVLARLLEAFQAERHEVGRRRMPRGAFSAGIAVFPRHGHTLEQLLTRADRGLYAAKSHGRARIELAPPTGFATLG